MDGEERILTAQVGRLARLCAAANGNATRAAAAVKVEICILSIRKQFL